MQKKGYRPFSTCHATYVLFFTPGYVVIHPRGPQLLGTYLETALEVDEEMHLCVVFSSFAAASARGVFQFNFPELLRPFDADC